MQSFAVGHNFPTEYPALLRRPDSYHFLFYFQAGNLEFLGLDPAWSLNLLSIITIVAMLMLVMTLGEALFDSRAVGRVGSALFFFFGSLSYIPFLHKQGSLRGVIQSILHLGEFLPTIFPYRGEAWGTWSQVTFLNQRHFASAIGILLLVLTFLAIQYRAFYAKRAAATPSGKTLTPEPVLRQRVRQRQSQAMRPPLRIFQDRQALRLLLQPRSPSSQVFLPQEFFALRYRGLFSRVSCLVSCPCGTAPCLSRRSRYWQFYFFCVLCGCKC